jgi:hypothetical protein
MTATTAFLYGGGAWLILFAVLIVALWWRQRQPITDTDRYCAAADQRLDELADRRPLVREACDGIGADVEAAEWRWAA